MNQTITITTKSIAKQLNKIKVSNFDSSAYQFASAAKMQLEDEKIKQISWEDEDSLAQLFQEIGNEEIELANNGLKSYADSLAQFDNFER